jgi:cytochrome c-type biogenesis protein CcmE
MIADIFLFLFVICIICAISLLMLLAVENIFDFFTIHKWLKEDKKNDARTDKSDS